MQDTELTTLASGYMTNDISETKEIQIQLQIRIQIHDKWHLWNKGNTNTISNKNTNTWQMTYQTKEIQIHDKCHMKQREYKYMTNDRWK